MFALTCLLQIEQVNSESDDTDDDPLSLALRFLRFRSASQTLFANIYAWEDRTYSMLW